MNNFTGKAGAVVQSFVKEEAGAQVVEYALIIAVVSIGLAIALGDAGTGLRSSLADLFTRVSNCMTGTCS